MYGHSWTAAWRRVSLVPLECNEIRINGGPKRDWRGHLDDLFALIAQGWEGVSRMVKERYTLVANCAECWGLFVLQDP